MNFEHACDDSGDAGKGNALVRKACTAISLAALSTTGWLGLAAMASGQAQAGEAGFIRSLKGQAAQTGQVERSRPMRKRRG